MKKNFTMLAFMLVFAFTTVFADDGETGNGNRVPPPPPPAARTSSTNTNSSETTSSSDMFVIVLDALRALTGK